MTLSGSIVILTLEQHKEGIWIRRLVEELNEIVLDDETALATAEDIPRSTATLTFEVQSLERWIGQGWSVSTPSLFSNITGIVNRVSDAASPALFKLCLAILTAARASGIPIINGPTAYSFCGNKWCHHVLFQQAGLQSPPTKFYYHTLDDPATENMTTSPDEDNRFFGGPAEKNFEVLVKPNSGGFGAGITKLSFPPEDIPFFDDGIVVLQQYVTPKDRKLHRVWFLNGIVQCGVERIIQDGTNNNDEFTGACAGSTCSLNANLPSLEACTIPGIVRQEIEQQLLPSLPDAHCGSVEYMVTESGERLYFDLNLLSTLPLPSRVSDPHGIWGENYNPWKELAKGILQQLQQRRTGSL